MVRNQKRKLHKPEIKPHHMEELYSAIRRLKETDRGVILLYLEDKSYQENHAVMNE